MKRNTDPDFDMPWTGFDLINAFNAWKKTAAAGRVFAIDAGGVAEVQVTGLTWRTELCQPVFEEAAVDCSRALSAWLKSRRGKRRGRRVGFPRFKKKSRGMRSFRLRNKQPKGGKSAIRVGDNDRPRSVTLPGIGTLRTHDDTRRLRRMVTKGRARILFATVSHRAERWWVALNVEASELHPARWHPDRPDSDPGSWVGVDRGLSAFVVAASADGREVARIQDASKALAVGLRQQRRLSKSLSRKKKGSLNHRRVGARLARHHDRIASIRRHFLHAVSNELVKNHDRLVIEDLNVSGMLANSHLARAISDAGWAEFARLLRYKSEWRRGRVETADRWYPSSQVCSRCGARCHGLTLTDRIFTCPCGYSADRDLNAAVNLAQWGENSAHLQPGPPSRVAGQTMPADGTALADTSRVSAKPTRMTREPTFMLQLRSLNRRTPEKGGAGELNASYSARLTTWAGRWPSRSLRQLATASTR